MIKSLIILILRKLIINLRKNKFFVVNNMEQHQGLEDEWYNAIAEEDHDLAVKIRGIQNQIGYNLEEKDFDRDFELKFVEDSKIGYSSSREGLEQLCITNKHSPSIRRGLIDILAVSINLPFVALSIYGLGKLFADQDDGLWAQVISGSAIVVGLQMKSFIKVFANGAHNLIDTISSKFYPLQNNEGDAYFVKGKYTNEPSRWDVRSGKKLLALERPNDFLIPPEGAYGFVNGLEVTDVIDHEHIGRSLPYQIRKYKTKVKGNLDGHVITLTVHHQGKDKDNFYIRADSATKPSFYLNGPVRIESDGYHMNLKDYGTAFTNLSLKQ